MLIFKKEQTLKCFKRLTVEAVKNMKYYKLQETLNFYETAKQTKPSARGLTVSVQLFITPAMVSDSPFIETINRMQSGTAYV